MLPAVLAIIVLYHSSESRLVENASKTCGNSKPVADSQVKFSFSRTHCTELYLWDLFHWADSRTALFKLHYEAERPKELSRGLCGMPWRNCDSGWKVIGGQFETCDVDAEDLQRSELRDFGVDRKHAWLLSRMPLESNLLWKSVMSLQQNSVLGYCSFVWHFLHSVAARPEFKDVQSNNSKHAGYLWVNGWTGAEKGVEIFRQTKAGADILRISGWHTDF